MLQCLHFLVRVLEEGINHLDTLMYVHRCAPVRVMARRTHEHMHKTYHKRSSSFRSERGSPRCGTSRFLRSRGRVPDTCAIRGASYGCTPLQCCSLEGAATVYICRDFACGGGAAVASV